MSQGFQRTGNGFCEKDLNNSRVHGGNFLMLYPSSRKNQEQTTVVPENVNLIIQFLVDVWVTYVGWYISP